MTLARHNLFQDKTRLGLRVTGVAQAVTLILILSGFVSGMNQQVSAYLDNTPGSVVLIQAGTHGASSVLAADAAEAARRVRGVASAVPVIVQWAVLDLGQTKQYINVVGYDSAFYFCSRGCKAEFMVDPTTFVGERSSEAQPSPSPTLVGAV